MEHTFDWKPRFDEKSRGYSLRDVVNPSWASRKRNKLWSIGKILDQGSEGACVGFSWTSEALSAPVKVDFSRMKQSAPSNPFDFAINIYKQAKKIDEWAGENYEGTSILAGAKVMKSLGIVKEYRWAFSIDDVVDTVLAKGPVVIGSYWYSGMVSPDSEGFISTTGSIVGGHAYLVVGYSLGENGKEDSLIIQNSWGNSWGSDGKAKIAVSELSGLLRNDGEACVPYRRSYGR